MNLSNIRTKLHKIHYICAWILIHYCKSSVVRLHEFFCFNKSYIKTYSINTKTCNLPISLKMKSSGFLTKKRAAVGKVGRVVDSFFFGLFSDIKCPISMSPVAIARLKRSKLALALLFFLAWCSRSYLDFLFPASEPMYYQKIFLLSKIMLIEANVI